MSEARSQRAEEYRHSRQLHAVRTQAAEREAGPDGAPADTAPSQVVLIVKADVQVRPLILLSRTVVLVSCCYLAAFVGDHKPGHVSMWAAA